MKLEKKNLRGGVHKQIVRLVPKTDTIFGKEPNLLFCTYNAFFYFKCYDFKYL